MSGLEEAELFRLLREMGYLHTAAARHSRVELQHVDACPRSGMMGGGGGREASARSSDGMRACVGVGSATKGPHGTPVGMGGDRPRMMSTETSPRECKWRAWSWRLGRAWTRSMAL